MTPWNASDAKAIALSEITPGSLVRMDAIGRTAAETAS